MSTFDDDDITTEPTEADEDRDTGGHGGADTGDEPTEAAPEPEEQPEEQPSQDLFDDDGGQ